MANDRVAFYKTVRVGDFVPNLETLAGSGEPATFEQTTSATSAAVIPRGSSGFYRCDFLCKQMMNHLGDETDVAYRARRRALVSSLQASKPGSGLLVFVADSTTQLTTCVTDGQGPGASTIEIADDLEDSDAGDLFYIGNGTTGEIVTLTAYDSVTPSFEAVLAGTQSSGDVVARLEWYLPNAWLMSEIAVGSQTDQPGYFITDDIALSFQSLTAPVNQT